jgi:hypothetical protein
LAASRAETHKAGAPALAGQYEPHQARRVLVADHGRVVAAFEVGHLVARGSVDRSAGDDEGPSACRTGARKRRREAGKHAAHSGTAVFCYAELRRGAKCHLIVFAEAAMDFDPTTRVATPKNWLETRAHYEGAARAEFTNPPGAIEGPATVCVNSAGRCRVRIKIEKIDAPDATGFGGLGDPDDTACSAWVCVNC